MKAIIYTQYGGPEVLHLRETEIPRPADDEVLVKVFAASINDWDWGLMQGDFVNRILSGLTKPGKQILGSDIAGVVEAVGKNVKKFKHGDEVFGDLSGRWGGFAEYVCASENALAIKPGSMTFEAAAAIPQAAMLAVQGLIDKGRIRSGQRILINGAGGGVGTYGLQIARSLGVEVVVVDEESKLGMLREMGAADAIDYTKEDFTRRGEQFDLILDAKTNRPILNYLRALKPNGMYVTVGGSLVRLLQALLLGPFVSAFTSKKVTIVALKANKDLDYMSGLFLAGKVRSVIHGPFRLEETRKAFELFAAAKHKGKIVISIADRRP